MSIRPLLLSLFLCTLAPLSAQEKAVPSRITAAKVFRQGAQVTRTASTGIPAGAGTIVFAGLAQHLDPQSIQVTGKGGYTILSVNHRLNYLSENPLSKEMEALVAQEKKLTNELNTETATKQVWEQEEQLLLKNTAIAGQQQGVTAAQLQAVNDYVRERLRAVKRGVLEQNTKIAALNEELGKLRQQLQVLRGQHPQPTSEVVVELTSPAAVTASFTLDYFVPAASWTPAYDLRATAVGKPVQLLMKAEVTNNTGEDWDKVDLSLSSGNPTLGGVMPALHPWTLYTYRPRPRASRTPMNQKAEAEAVTLDAVEISSRGAAVDAIRTAPVAMQQQATTMEYSISTPFTVPSDGSPRTIGVQEHAITATYTHYATPKLDKDAFLYARTTGWEDLGLLSGEANVFFEGTYVGKSYLELDVPKDTIAISLGRDKGVVVERVKRKASDQKALIGGNRTQTIGWDLTVRNSKGTAVELEIRDQFPLSPQSEVEVKLTEKGGATVDDNKGLLTWTLSLAPKETKKLGFAYTVKHPKDMPVVLE